MLLIIHYQIVCNYRHQLNR